MQLTGAFCFKCELRSVMNIPEKHGVLELLVDSVGQVEALTFHAQLLSMALSQK
jgi:hypothetical protein